MTGIFLINDRKELVEMTETPYDSENLLQTLLAEYPDLIAGDQVNDADPRRWLLVAREASLPSEEDGVDRWSVDHLFLDQEGIPTLVEVKRSRDTRIRREVAGQMLDYAANAVVYWPIEEIRAKFEIRCGSESKDPSQILQDYLGLDGDENSFWDRVKTNLEAGKIRMIFVADEIPRELRRIIEFLNGQMDPAEVLGLEIRQYVGGNGKLKTLVPRVIGQSAGAQDKKKGRETKQWDEKSFFEELEARHGAEKAEVARRILEWARGQKLRIWWGKGAKYGTFYPMFDHDGRGHWTMSAWTKGDILIPFGWIKRTPAFAEESTRDDLLERLNRIPGVSLPPESIDFFPAFDMHLLQEPSALRLLFETWSWMLDTIRNHTADADPPDGAGEGEVTA